MPVCHASILLSALPERDFKISLRERESSLNLKEEEERERERERETKNVYQQMTMGVPK